METIRAGDGGLVRQGPAGRGWAAARRLHGVLRRVLRACAARPAAAGAAALVAYYLSCYLGDQYLPGNNPQVPLGWWSWWDQGKYLDSARALSRGVLAPDRHWYPLGYPILGTPFLQWSRGHPFLPVNLVSLLACMAGFLAFARRVGVGRGWAVALFLLGTAGSRTLFEGWLVPWNTIPVAACLWLLLAATAAHMAGERRPLLIGMLAAAIPLLRPTEALLAAPCVLAAVAASLWPGQMQRGRAERRIAGRGIAREGIPEGSISGGAAGAGGVAEDGTTVAGPWQADIPAGGSTVAVAAVAGAVVGGPSRDGEILGSQTQGSATRGRATWGSPAAGSRVRDIALIAAGGLLLAVPYGLLHWRIYGMQTPPYLAMSAGIGFTLQDLGWKAYVLLVDPRDWFLEGRGLLSLAPYAALAGAGLVVAWAHGRAAGLLAILIVLHGLLYLSYVDLLPVGMWRFFNVHYWQWALPGLALLAFLVVRDLMRWRRAPGFPLAPLAVAATLLLLLLRPAPVEVPAGTPAKMLAYAGTPPTFEAAYLGAPALRDSAGEVRGLGALRALPVPGGMRVYALRRPFGDDPVWVAPPPGWMGTAPPVRYGIAWRLSVPCWTRLAAC